MDLEQPQRRDPGLGPVANRSSRTHSCTVTASSRGLRGRHSTSDVPTTSLCGMFHGFDALGSLVLAPPILTRSHPDTSYSIDPDCDRSYIDRVHYYPIRELPGAQPAPLVGQHFGQSYGRENDELTVQIGGDGKGGDAEGEVQGMNVHGDDEEEGGS
ncbi:hypothetical protein M9H77_02121 [Catharanthus roseus]|uniref:Uncharacterized protein n=1 Tax=Catharanthus roseus TaxID=4058 RepID=A0ACC0C7W6_CATRO|nr:hypothetical protein M9H77_02121 [Catharanthus roseus]